MCTVPSLAVTVTLYLIIGSAVNISKGKSTCPEMLPQYDFWKAFFKSAIVSATLPECVLNNVIVTIGGSLLHC